MQSMRMPSMDMMPAAGHRARIDQMLAAMNQDMKAGRMRRLLEGHERMMQMRP
jgi:hypothetical protein